MNNTDDTNRLYAENMRTLSNNLKQLDDSKIIGLTKALWTFGLPEVLRMKPELHVIFRDLATGVLLTELIVRLEELKR